MHSNFRMTISSALSITFVALLFSLYFFVASVQQKMVQTTATLTYSRYAFAATSLGELVFFGGGSNDFNLFNLVDICNVTSGSWTTATLSTSRVWLAATSLVNLVFFAGGIGGIYYNQVDIYNISNGNWSSATLSQARYLLVATSVGSLVFFGGGVNSSGVLTNVVDIYNVTSNTWTTATLSQARAWLAATAVANGYALFAGGINTSEVSNFVDIYDSLNEVWSTATLSQARLYFAATSLGNLSFFGGGLTSAGQESNIVDIFNATSQTWSNETLSQARSFLAAAAIGDIVAFGGGWNGSASSAVVDMYNATSTIWFTTSLSQPRYFLVATASTDKIFFAGGAVFDTVDIFDFNPFASSPQVPLSPSNVPQLYQSPAFPPKSVSSTLTMNLSPSLPPPLSNQSGGNFGEISGSILAVIVSQTIALALVVGLAIVLVILLVKEKRKKKKYDQHVENVPMSEQKSETVVIEDDPNKVVSDNDEGTSLSTYQPGAETLKRLSPGQIPLNELEIGKEIGNGYYGRVCVGKWRKYQVALKFCQNKGKMDEFMREANLMISLPPHPNVVRMYGVSIDGTQPIIVMEYCAGGSLDKVLYDIEMQISEEQKIRWVCEIAQGMIHLHKFNIVHRDLAARNILLSRLNPSTARLKITDFGMSRVLQQDIEGKTLNPVGPIRWMAPESIRDQVYSKKSDVWMFGVLVYEIVARREPHVDVDPNNVLILIRNKGLTPTIPDNCPEKLRQLMEMCWQKQPEQRPSFEIICEVLEQQNLPTVN